MNKIFRKTFIVILGVSLFSISFLYTGNRFFIKKHSFYISQYWFNHLKDLTTLDAYETPKDIEKQGVIIKQFQLNNITAESRNFLDKSLSIFFNKKIEEMPLNTPFYKIIRFYDDTKLLSIVIRPNENTVFYGTMTLFSLEDIVRSRKLFLSALLILTAVFSLVISFFVSRKISKLSKLTSEVSKLENLNNELIQSSKHSFITGIAHELKTPIAIISGYIESIREGVVEEENIPAYYDIIETQINDVNLMINDLLFYFKLESGITQMEMENFYMDSFLKRLLGKFRADIENFNLSLNLQEGIIYSNRKVLSMVISNLLTNAFAHCDDKKEIAVSFEENVFTISNSSQYFSEEEIKDFFNSFNKFTTGKTKKYGGTGIGLSIVPKFIALLNLNYDCYYSDETQHFVFKIYFDQKKS